MTFMEKIAVSIIVVALLGTITATFSTPFIKLSDAGRGTHTGYITAVDQRGYIFQNYEVYFKTDNSSSQEDMYCVHRDNPQLAENLKRLSIAGERVTIEYHGVRGVGLGLCHLTEIDRIRE